MVRTMTTRTTITTLPKPQTFKILICFPDIQMSSSFAASLKTAPQISTCTRQQWSLFQQKKIAKRRPFSGNQCSFICWQRFFNWHDFSSETSLKRNTPVIRFSGWNHKLELEQGSQFLNHTDTQKKSLFLLQPTMYSFSQKHAPLAVDWCVPI